MVVRKIRYRFAHRLTNPNFMNTTKTAPQIVYITLADLLAFLLTIGVTTFLKNRFVNVVMTTTPDMRKTNNPYFDKVRKHTSRQYHLMIDYGKSVENGAEKEGIIVDYEVEKPKGKHHISPVVLMDDKTNSIHYLNLRPYENVPATTIYTFEGNRIDYAMFSSYLTAKSNCAKQPQQNKVLCITPKLTNIHSITIDETKYVVIGTSSPIV